MVVMQNSDVPSQDAPAGEGHVIERPFYFITVVWGRGYCDQFLQYCVASLLAPGNIPALCTRRRSRFLIGTLRADWDYMRATPIFRELERYVEAVLIEIPPRPADTLACVHMGVGHVAACGMAHADKAYGVILAPDSVISDGTVRNLQKHAAAGIELVWVAALRFGQEPFLGHLYATGALSEEDRSQSCKPLAISGRALVLAGVNGMHSETLTYEWDSSYFVNGPSAVWWRVPGENGIVLHSLSWAPLLLDFAAARTHDTSALETWTIDGDYVFKNLGASPKMHVVQDSDEMFYCGWSALTDRPYPLAPRFTNRFAWQNSLAKADEFRRAFHSPLYDPLKRSKFFLPVRWHANPINSRWRRVERRSQRILRFALSQSTFRSFSLPGIRLDVAGPARHACLLAARGAHRLGLAVPRLGERVSVLATAVWRKRHMAGSVLKGAVSGDAQARAEIAYRLRQAAVLVFRGRHLARPGSDQ
jgi:hypothetical protein